MRYQTSEEVKLANDAKVREDERAKVLAEFKRVYFDDEKVIRCAELILGSNEQTKEQTNE